MFLLVRLGSETKLANSCIFYGRRNSCNRISPARSNQGARGVLPSKPRSTAQQSSAQEKSGKRRKKGGGEEGSAQYVIAD
jgi:hypothetical protein